MRDRYQVAPHEHTHTWTEEELQRVSDYLQILTESKPEYQGSYVPGECYEQGDIVMDSGWQMIANKATCDKPAPQPIGAQSYVYQGTSPEDAITASQLAVGQRYQLPSAGYLNGYRVYTVAGNDYSVYVVIDPDGANELSELISFTADETGWQAFSIAPLLVALGTTFELWVRISEPDPTPTTWTGDWDYDTPPNAAVPPAGVAVHGNSTPGTIEFSKTDDNAGDRGAELLALDPGDIINGPGGIRWSIQSAPVDNGLSVSFAIAPSQQSAPDGLFSFVFETVTATPIVTVIDPDYFLPNANVSGLYIIDDGAPVATEDAYGIDVLVQEAKISDDWDPLSAPPSSVGGGGVTDVYNYVKYNSLIDLPDTWTQIGSLTTENSPSGVYEYKMAMSWVFDRTTESVFFRWRETDEQGVWSGWNESEAEPKDKTDTNNAFYSYPIEWPGGVKQFEVEVMKELNSIGQLDVNFFDMVWEFKK